MIKSIIFVTTNIPCGSTGSTVVINRHLKSYKGKVIIIYTDNNIPIDTPDNWTLIKVDENKLKNSYAKRFKTSYIDLHKLGEDLILKLSNYSDNECAVLNMFGKRTLLAYEISKLLKKPLNIIMHDDYNVWNKDVDKLISLTQLQEIINYSSRVWSVSKNLALKYKANNINYKLLYPIPSKNINNIKKTKNKINFYYYGSIRKTQIPLFLDLLKILKEINGKLIYIGKNNIPDEIMTKEFIKKEFMNTNDLFKEIQKEAFALFMPGSFEKLNNSLDFLSFPSKFVEYCQLNTPIIIYSNKNGNLGKWAIKNKWNLYVQNKNKLEKKILMLQNKNYYNRCLKETKVKEFNPDIIQKQFEDELVYN